MKRLYEIGQLSLEDDRSRCLKQIQILENQRENGTKLQQMRYKSQSYAVQENKIDLQLS